LLVWILTIVGVVQSWKRSRRITLTFVGVLIVCALLAAGIGSGWLSAHIPFFAGYREPQKFAGLVALSVAVFLGIAAERLVLMRNNKYYRVLIVAGFLLHNVLYTSVMYWGFDGQLVPRQYPADWYTMRDTISQDHGDFKVLFLPWHLYMRYQFAGRVIASPAPGFFGGTIISSDDPEMDGVKPAVSDATKQKLGDEILPSGKESDDFVQQLSNLKIKYILLAKDANYRDYSYIDDKGGLKPVATGSSLVLYRNNEYRE
jgi:hypothetical protein